MSNETNERTSWVNDIVNSSQTSVSSAKKKENNNSSFSCLIEVDNNGMKYNVTKCDVKFIFNKKENPTLTQYIDESLKKIKETFQLQSTTHITIHISMDKNNKITSCQVEMDKNGKKIDFKDKEIWIKLERSLESLKQKTIKNSNCFPNNDVNNQKIPELPDVTTSPLTLGN